MTPACEMAPNMVAVIAFAVGMVAFAASRFWDLLFLKLAHAIIASCDWQFLAFFKMILHFCTKCLCREDMNIVSSGNYCYKACLISSSTGHGCSSTKSTKNRDWTSVSFSFRPDVTFLALNGKGLSSFPHSRYIFYVVFSCPKFGSIHKYSCLRRLSLFNH
jgi:hypothetical protein